MIIEELELTNVRSYSHALIKFPLGRTLFEGDIGSGKSSILMAIEFGLFGLGSEPGASILKLGESSGEVRLLFDVGGKEYEVRRGLEKKSGRVQQTEGQLRTPETALTLSPSELKEKMLEVLEFNEMPDPKAQSWIYRYAVYTPQERMKEVIALSPDLRLQILRRAFRVEDYKIAAENALGLSREIRGDMRELEGMAAGIEKLEEEAETLVKQETEHRGTVAALQTEAAGCEEWIQALRTEREKLKEEELGLERVKVEGALLRRSIVEFESDLLGLEREIGGLKGKADRVAQTTREIRSQPPQDRLTVGELKKKERRQEDRVRRLTGLLAATESKLSDYQSIIEKGVCPVCDRPIEAHDFKGRTEAKEAEKQHFSAELAATEAELERTRRAREAAEEYRLAKEKKARQLSELSRLKKDIERKAKARKRVEKRARYARTRLNDVESESGKLDEVAVRVKRNAGELQKAEAELRGLRDRLSDSRARLELVTKRQAAVGIEIVAKRSAGVKRDRLQEDELWLSDYFVPTVQLVERSVLSNLNQEFNSLFQRWFGMLVSDPEKEVRVDDNFTPIVSQGGYEQDVEYLSGGERTSVALAYRLALNTLTQRATAGMKSNLLILDEPTDGFSREQLGNMREVLDDVGCTQVVIVSHDNELESFADQVFRVTKDKGESKLEAGGTQAPR